MKSQRIVYVIDDDLGIRESLGGLLVAAGYDVHVFAEPDAFLAFAKPDLPSWPAEFPPPTTTTSCSVHSVRACVVIE